MVSSIGDARVLHEFCLYQDINDHGNQSATPLSIRRSRKLRTRSFRMNAVSSYAVTERPLESLGISAAEECAYVALLDHPESTLAELSSALAWPARKVQRLLDALQGMGLVTVTAGEPRRFVPSWTER